MVCKVATKLLLLLFLACYANITLFSHIHVMDGVVIVHSHFYLKGHLDEGNQSPHSEEEIEFINAIGKVVAEAQSLVHVAISNIAIEIHPHFAELLVSIAAATMCALPLLRAPPRTL